MSVDAVAHHDEAGEAEAEGPALVFFGVDAAGFEDIFVDHAGAHEFDPAAFFADAAAFACAEEAGEIELEAWFDEGEVAWAEAHGDFFFKEAGEEFGHDAFEVAREMFLSMRRPSTW
jgi:hypothetical protein